MTEKECIYYSSDDLAKTGKDICFPFINYFCNFCGATYGVWDEEEYKK